MTALDQILYRAPGGPTGLIVPAAGSLDRTDMGRWLKRLYPWLRAGAPLGRGYLALGSEAALIRWDDNRATGNWQFAHVLTGPAAALSARHGLLLPTLTAELQRLPWAGRLPQVDDASLGAWSAQGTWSAQGAGSAQGAVESQARSAGAMELLVPLLSLVLSGQQSVIMPWTGPLLPEAVSWGLLSIMAMTGDRRPVSFLIRASAQPVAPPGLFVSFREGIAAPRPHPGFERMAIGLATSYADDPARLYRTLAQYGIPEAADHAERLARLADMWPQTQNARPEGTVTQPPATPAPSPTPTPAGQGREVICPICLHQIDDWEGLPHWRWDSVQNRYAEVKIPAGASRQLRARMQRGTMVRCPDPHQVMAGEHYLPADYGRFGPPVVLGFIGVTLSSKSHLLAAMVGEIERNGLRDYGISSRPIDHALHRKYLDDSVRPLLKENKVIPGTGEGVVTFADAFLISPEGGLDRPVALFDVAGADLISVTDTKQFLEVADGLIFVVDPGQMDSSGLGDDAFNTVLDLVKSTGRLPDEVSAAVVLSKADLVRFEDPVARWLRSDTKVLDAAEFVSESADIYAFLYDKGAVAWTRPYRECARATLHAASPTGGPSQLVDGSWVFPRGVTPRRVLRPLVAMLAMTGVLTGPEAERVGI